jgi:hypothetical protein
LQAAAYTRQPSPNGHQDTADEPPLAASAAQRNADRTGA